MVTRNEMMNFGPVEAQVMIPDLRMEIDLEGAELLKLDIQQPGTQVVCTGGTLWLTQTGDSQDHFLKAGQSFTFYQAGMALVQGLPCGKARIVEMGAERLLREEAPCAAAG